MSDSIPCPDCRATKTKVVDSRPDYSRGSITRRRECQSCGCRWTTYEIDRDRLELLEENIRPNRRGPDPYGVRP